MNKDASVARTGGELDGRQLQDMALARARALDGVTEGYPFTPKLLVLKAAGKVFLVVTEDDEERIVTLKADPEDVDRLAHEYTSIQPGRYFNKRHWVSVSAGPDISPKLVEQLVQDSYDLATDGIDRSHGARGKK